MAAFYPKCRECSCRDDDTVIAEPALFPVPAPVPALRVTPNVFRTNGIRGRYVNQIDRRVAGELAGAFASLLWEADPLPVTGIGRPGPSVVVGFDERPSSPDLVTGVAAALRRMSCQVIDIGQCTRPCFWHGVHHLNATAGVFVSGAGCDPSYTGLDFVGPEGLPASAPGLLESVERRWCDGFTRAARSPGSQRSFQAWVPYEAGLWKHFHALRPLHVVVSCSNATVREMLERLFRPLACRLTLLASPIRAVNLLDPADEELVRLAARVVEDAADLGVAIGEDGQQTVFVDESGTQAPPDLVLELVTRCVQREQPGTHGLSGSHSFEELGRLMRSCGARVGGDPQGFVWLADPFPTCDGVVTLAKVLQALSQSDARFSEAMGSLAGAAERWA